MKTITREQLTERLLSSHSLLVGEYRNGRVQSSNICDNNSGEKIQRHEIVYAVECGNTLGSVLIFRQLPDDADVSKAEIGLIKGRRYVFELDFFQRKANGVTARLGYREPELLDEPWSALPSP